MNKKLLVLNAILVMMSAPSVNWSSARSAFNEKTEVGAVATASPSSAVDSAAAWQAGAKLHKGFSKVPGTLILDAAGVEFRPNKGSSLRWVFVEIQTVYMAPRKFVLKSYERRGRLRLGTREFRFELGEDMPSSVSAELAERIGRPVRNGLPSNEVLSGVTVPVHHITPRGGSNGVLRLSDSGIDYVARKGNDSRSWRWTDIQTLSYPDLYHLTVFGYLETYSFNLNQPLPAGSYDRATDEIFKHSEAGLRGTRNKNEAGPKSNPE